MKNIVYTYFSARDGSPWLPIDTTFFPLPFLFICNEITDAAGDRHRSRETSMRGGETSTTNSESDRSASDKSRGKNTHARRHQNESRFSRERRRGDNDHGGREGRDRSRFAASGSKREKRDNWHAREGTENNSYSATKKTRGNYGPMKTQKWEDIRSSSPREHGTEKRSGTESRDMDDRNRR